MPEFLTFLILTGSFWVIKQLQIIPSSTNQKIRFWHIWSYDVWIFGEKVLTKLKYFLRIK